MRKKFLGLMLALCMTVSFVPCVHAAEIVASGECGGSDLNNTIKYPVYYTFYSDGRMVISGSGKMKSYMGDVVPWDNYKENIKSLTVEQGVTNVGTDTFYNCTNLTDVYLAEGIESIGIGTFSACTNLRNIKIPSTLTTIYWGAFSECSSLTQIEIPVSVISIWHAAFYECTSLKDVYYNGREEQWNKISIESGENEYFLNANIHFLTEPCFTISKSTITNTADTEQTAVVICADYTNGVLTDINTQSVTFSAGQSKQFSYGNGAEHKIFVWDSLGGMKSLCKDE